MNISNYMSNNPKSTEVQNLLIVDPNPCGSAVINTEDLSISVELEVFRRSDDIIIFDDSKDYYSVTNSINPSETTRISFIDGSGDSKKFLTTNYTELNTKFGKENDELGTLGIESIDISFNTSYTPIVKIRFKDIRGKLFEMGNDSPYSFLFRMPYPIFYLTVKGYFGKPVRYALHLTKFNGALDSDTGSFIITCDFIGYTYAFLSDILMGFLKAIPYTNQSKGLEADGFVTFDELRDVIKELEKFIIKYKQDDEKLRALTIYGDLVYKLDGISAEMKRSLKLNGKNSVDLSDNGLNTSKIISYTLNDDKLTAENEKTYQDTVLKLIEDYNNFTKTTKANIYALDENKFKLNNDGAYFKNFTVFDFLTGPDNNKRFKSFEEFQEDSSILKKYPNYEKLNNIEKDNITEKLFNNFQDILREAPFASGRFFTLSKYNLLDFRFALQNINDLKTKLNNELADKKTEVTEDFVTSLSTFLSELGINYDGSIGSLFKILSQHVDLFVRTIRRVGTLITGDIIAGYRNIEAGSVNNFSDGVDDGNGSGPISIKAFPEYVEKEENGLVEKWLGSNPKFSNFREVEFIDDFYQAILKSAMADEESAKNTETNEIGWYPVNPLETKASNSSNTNPWLLPSNSNQYPIEKLLYERMVTYLAYTNKSFNNVSEIAEMAKIEANQAFAAIKNDSVKNSLIPNGASDVVIGNKICEIEREMKTRYGISLNDNGGFFADLFGEDTVTYRHMSGGYEFIPADDAIKPSATYIPITQTIEELEDSSNSLNQSSVRDNYSGTFISTIASNTLVNPNVPNPLEKQTFIKILKANEYNASFAYEPYTTKTASNLTDTISEAKVDISAINNSLGGTYKTHEFIKYKHPNVGELPLYYEFYEKGNEVVRSYRKKDNFEYDTYLKTDNSFSYNPSAKKVLSDNDKQKIKSLYVNTNLKAQLVENYVTNNTNNRAFKFESTFKSSGKVFSLFGSEFYYSQSDIGRALLFLHTIPFAGLGSDRSIKGIGLLSGKILNFFNQRAGFVSVPYSWILFLGAMIYRNAQTDDIIIFNKTNGDSLIPNLSDDSSSIKKDGYLAIYGQNMEFGNPSGGKSYGGWVLSNVIKRLPKSVKKEFVSVFKNWLNDSNGWVGIKNKLEIFSESNTRIQRSAIWNNFNPNSAVLNPNLAENYSIVSKTNEENTFFLDVRDDSPASDIVVEFLLENRIILNSTYRIWEANENRFNNFEIPTVNVRKYLQTFLVTFSDLNKPKTTDPIDDINTKIFKTNNVDDIKLSLYKNIKSIYDKWIVGIPQSQEGVVVTNLFDRFKFIDRSYSDIANKFKLAPTGFIDFWSDNTNISFYNFIARILRDNNFDFIPLPTFIDYKSQKDVRDVFKPFRYNEALPTNGPQFICMYFGEQSSKLNVDKNSKFKKNDSFSIDARCENDNIVVRNYSELPDDFKEENDKIPYVLVNYADQNQSMFKSFSLDQNEFVETQESLEIIENLSNQNRNNSIGQNLFDIYNNRSYSCEVEMLGCAQIQPFMYFQLNNVPMFDGAYTIINTRHQIKPNHMTTTFKGVRIRSVKTKMVDNETLYAHLIGNLNDVSKEGADFSAINSKDTDPPVKGSKGKIGKTSTKKGDIDAKIYTYENTIFNEQLTPIPVGLLTAEKIDIYINSIKASGKDAPLKGQDFIDLALKFKIPLELALLQGAQESQFGTKGAATRTFNIYNVFNVTQGDTLTPEEAMAKGYRRDYGDWINGVKAYSGTIKKYIPTDGNWLRLLDYDKFRRPDYDARYAATKDYEGTLRVQKRKLENIVNT